ncbi:cyclic-amp response element binding protein [Anaeramoeba flamelloides]|uniref:Cyclic-amp response element binding protein n=1 Tax=Anaeramoeba flamelloides TaxID=1746091 RepID=A0ABQ8YR30_9EUKA|nr:cyclic-amp response element binding protein [Anaeramoeba flamelloides]
MEQKLSPNNTSEFLDHIFDYDTLDSLLNNEPEFQSSLLTNNQFAIEPEKNKYTDTESQQTEHKRTCSNLLLLPGKQKNSFLNKNQRKRRFIIKKKKKKTRSRTKTKEQKDTPIQKKTTKMLSPIEKRRRILEQKRISAKKSRERKKFYIQELENKNNLYEKQNQELHNKMRKLKGIIGNLIEIKNLDQILEDNEKFSDLQKNLKKKDLISKKCEQIHKKHEEKMEGTNCLKSCGNIEIEDKNPKLTNNLPYYQNKSDNYAIPIEKQGFFHNKNEKERDQDTKEKKNENTKTESETEFENKSININGYNLNEGNLFFSNCQQSFANFFSLFLIFFFKSCHSYLSQPNNQIASLNLDANTNNDSEGLPNLSIRSFASNDEFKNYFVAGFDIIYGPVLIFGELINKLQNTINNQIRTTKKK